MIGWSPVADPVCPGRPPRKSRPARAPPCTRGWRSPALGRDVPVRDRFPRRPGGRVQRQESNWCTCPGGLATGTCPEATRRSGSGPSTVCSTSATPSRTRTGTMTWPDRVTGSSTCTPSTGSWWSASSPGERSTPRGDSRSPRRGFGPFGSKLLVGNFGDGRINAYELFAAGFGTLRNKHHRAITIDGLWALRAGTAMTGGTGTVVFSAGINNRRNGTACWDPSTRLTNRY